LQRQIWGTVSDYTHTAHGRSAVTCRRWRLSPYMIRKRLWSC
jgi:hypothetical protein